MGGGGGGGRERMRRRQRQRLRQTGKQAERLTDRQTHIPRDSPISRFSTKRPVQAKRTRAALKV